MTDLTHATCLTLKHRISVNRQTRICIYSQFSGWAPVWPGGHTRCPDSFIQIQPHRWRSKKYFRGTNYTDWIDLIFADKKQHAVQRIAFYFYYSMQNAELKMNAIAAFSVRIIKETLPAGSSIPNVKKFIAGQRSNILPYLPVVLQMVELLYDNTLDDRTHKVPSQA